MSGYTSSITEQMARAGKPQTTTQTSTTDEGADLGQLGLLIAMLLGGNGAATADPNAMIGEIMAPPGNSPLTGLASTTLMPTPLGQSNGIRQMSPQELLKLWNG